MAGRAWRVALVLSLVFLCDGGKASVPLTVEGQAGIWNQLVVGARQAYPDRTGGITLKSSTPLASFLDRETPSNYPDRWDLTVVDSRLAFVRGTESGKALETLTLDAEGHARFRGELRINGTLRSKSLTLEGSSKASGLVVGSGSGPAMSVDSDKVQGWIETQRGALAFNPSCESFSCGVSIFSSDPPRRHLDVHGETWLEKDVKFGTKAILGANSFTFENGGGWSAEKEGWMTATNSKDVHFDGGAVFGESLGIGGKVTQKGARLQVHDGHFVVSDKVAEQLKGVATYVMPTGSFIKAYDYSGEKLQKLRITGTTILVNPDPVTDGKTCIGCTNPEHHLETKGNMYVNGNVFVNRNLHVSGNVHVDKVITPKVFIHPLAHTPDYGRGLMIGNDLPNKYKTTTNMRLGYNKNYAWVQSHSENTPLVINPIGGATCVGCTELSREDVGLEVRGDAVVDGDLYVATLKPETNSNEGVKETLALLQEQAGYAHLSLHSELGADHMDLVNAWASTAKVVKSNSQLLQTRKHQIAMNANMIRILEAHLSTL